MIREIIIAVLVPLFLVSLALNACFISGKLYRVPSLTPEPGDYVQLLQPAKGR